MARKNNENTVKTDLFKICPQDIVVETGFNSRIKFELGELKESIKANGVLNPISVIPFTDEDGKEKYRLIDGERRFRAVMEAISEGADIARVPAIFLSKSCTQEELLIQQIARNEGEQFDEYEKAIAIRKIMDVGNYTVQEVLKKLGWQPWKSVYLAHLERDERVQALMREGKIEGVEVRKIYQAHKGDENGAVEEILKGATALGTVKNGKKVEKITLNTLKDIDSKSKTVAVKDSEKIHTGLKLLYKYINAYKGTGIEGEISISTIVTELEKGKDIVTILDEAVSRVSVKTAE